MHVLFRASLILNMLYHPVITGEDFYGAYDAQDFAIANSEAVGVTPVPSLNLVYTEEEVRSL